MKKFFVLLSMFLLGSIFVLPNLVLAENLNITQINFTTVSQTINSNTVSEVLTVQLQDFAGIKQQPGETVHLNLVSSSPTGEFSANADSWIPATSLTMNSNWYNRNFYYKDSASGTHTLTITADGKSWTAATQTIVVADPEGSKDPVLSDPDPESDSETVDDLLQFNSEQNLEANNQIVNNQSGGHRRDISHLLAGGEVLGAFDSQIYDIDDKTKTIQLQTLSLMQEVLETMQNYLALQNQTFSV